MGHLLSGEEGGLRGLGKASGVVSLGALAGYTVAIKSGVLNQVERVRGETELVLRDG
jgi:hypothetical protein